MGARRLDVAPRLAERSVIEGECVVWTGVQASRGRKEGNGYGVMYVNGKKTYVHRLVYERTHGPIPKGMLIRHSCDRPPCIRPDHLLLGTAADNSADMVARGRSRGGRRPDTAEGTLVRKSIQPTVEQWRWLTERAKSQSKSVGATFREVVRAAMHCDQRTADKTEAA